MSPCVRIGECGHTHTDSVSSTAAVCTSSTGRVHKEECTQSYVRTQVYLQLHVQNRACRCVCSSVHTSTYIHIQFAVLYHAVPCHTTLCLIMPCHAVPELGMKMCVQMHVCVHVCTDV